MIAQSRTNETGGLEPDLPEDVSASTSLLPDGTYRVRPASEEDAAAIRWHVASHAERAAIKRREREEAGIALTLPDGSTIQIPTGREDRAIMDGALLMLQTQPEREIRWKTSDGARIAVTYAELLAINSAVWEYVEACFDHEAELADDPEADLDAGWPSRERTLG